MVCSDVALHCSEDASGDNQLLSDYSEFKDFEKELFCAYRLLPNVWMYFSVNLKIVVSLVTKGHTSAA